MAASPSASAAARTRVNQDQLRYFAIYTCLLLIIFIAFHWTRHAFLKYVPKSNASHPIFYLPKVISRKARYLTVRKLSRFTPTGQALLVATFLGVNIALAFTNTEITELNLARRCGWILSADFIIVVFLSLKNTPLQILSAHSHERLNCLHRVVGHTCFVLVILHGALYTSSLSDRGRIVVLRRPENVAGIVAGFSFGGLVVSGVVIRKFCYEAFYVTHIACFIAAVITACYHQPDLESGVIIIFVLTAGIWLADRTIRALRMLFWSVNNEATLESLPHGATKITLAKGPSRAAPGQHCFVWMPKIRMFESHPFTIVAGEPMEFVVKACDGFTRDLHEYALAHPRVKLKASVDGPYGAFPDPMLYDRLVLVAGGSGASFTFGLALSMLDRMRPGSIKNITFIWTVKHHENLTWFSQHLNALQNHNYAANVKIFIHVTSGPAPSPDVNPPRSDAATYANNQNAPSDSEKEAASATTYASNRNAPSDSEKEASATTCAIDQNAPFDSEKAASAATCAVNQIARMASDETLAATYSTAGRRGGVPHERGLVVRTGRPDAAALVRDEVSATPPEGRVLVAVCGPEGLMVAVRNAAARLVRVSGPGVELHCEQFGW